MNVYNGLEMDKTIKLYQKETKKDMDLYHEVGPGDVQI